MPLSREIAEAIERAYLAGAVLQHDRGLAGELVLESLPVVEVFANSTGGGQDERWEGWPLLSLLGRRVASLDVSPSAGLSLVLALVDNTLEAAPGNRAFRRRIVAVFIEGYVSARDEEAARRAIEPLEDEPPLVELAPGCLLLVLRGELQAETLRAIVETVGRRLLSQDATALCVDVNGLRAPQRDRAEALFELTSIGQMLGCACHFSGVSAEWRKAALEAGVHLPAVQEHAGFSDALSHSLLAAGFVVRRASWLRRARKARPDERG